MEVCPYLFISTLSNFNGACFFGVDVICRKVVWKSELKIGDTQILPNLEMKIGEYTIS